MGVGSGVHVAGSKHSRLPASGSLLRLPWEAEAADPISQGRKQAQQLEGLPPPRGGQGTGNLRAGYLPTTKRPLERSARTFRQVAVEYMEQPALGGGVAQALGSEVRGLGSSPDVPPLLSQRPGSVLGPSGHRPPGLQNPTTHQLVRRELWNRTPPLEVTDHTAGKRAWKDAGWTP